MPIYVEIPGKGTAEFPDGMPYNQIKAVLARQFPPEPPLVVTPMEQVEARATEAMAHGKSPTTPFPMVAPTAAIPWPSEKPPVNFPASPGDITAPMMPLPKLRVNPSDTPVKATAKATVNAVVGLPEFFTSPLGMAVPPVVALAPTLTAAAFTVDMTRNLYKQGKDMIANWDKLTPAQQSEAIVNLTATTEFALASGVHAAKGIRQGIRQNAPILAERFKQFRTQQEQPSIPDSQEPAVDPIEEAVPTEDVTPTPEGEGRGEVVPTVPAPVDPLGEGLRQIEQQQAQNRADLVDYEAQRASEGHPVDQIAANEPFNPVIPSPVVIPTPDTPTGTISSAPSVVEGRGEVVPTVSVVTTPIDIPPQTPEVIPQPETPYGNGPLYESPPGVDVREPAGPGPQPAPVPESPRPPSEPHPVRPDVLPPAPESGPATGDVRGVRDVSGSPSGRPGDIGQPAEPNPVPGTESNLGQPGVTQTPEPPTGTLSAAASGGEGRGEVVPQVTQAPKTPTESDFNHILPSDSDWIPSGDKAKVSANLAAIRLVKQLDAENRNPTPAEKATLAQYTGWGGLKAIFDEGKAAYRDHAPRTPEQISESRNWERQWGKLYDEVKATLPEEEWNAAAKSILNAHYTSREIINGIWKAVEHLGFQGGKALEPAGGIGHFIGLTPESLRSKIQWRATELDPTSARIMARLYPEARVENTGFESSRIGANSQDLAISNVPFAADGPKDPRYPSLSLHNYFFARALDLVRPGGLVAFITSDSTMDNARSKAAREYMAERADLVGAIRLPNTAFKKNAGTEVTTDVLFFRKKDGTPFKGEDFTRTRETRTYNDKPIEVNEYYVNHPDMLMGRLSLEGSMYRENQPALLPTPGANLRNQIEEAIQKLPRNVIGERTVVQVEAEPTVELAGQGFKAGQLVLNEKGAPRLAQPDGSLQEPEWAGDAKKVTQAKRYVATRDAFRESLGVMLDPNKTDADVASSLARVNKLYDDYRAKHGAFNDRASRFLDDDVDYPAVMALEDANVVIREVKGKNGKTLPQKTTTYSKSKLLTERTMYPRRAPESADTVSDGLQVSMNYTGRVDTGYISRLTGKSVEQVKSELAASGEAFENPATGQWETRESYLSGFVKDKLKEAQARAQENPEYARNVAELEKVQPKPIPLPQIGFKLGSVWIPTEVIEGFLKDVLEVDAKVDFIPKLGEWSVTVNKNTSGSARNSVMFGVTEEGKHGNTVTRYTGDKLVAEALNLKTPEVRDPAGEDSTVRNEPLTLQAKEKQDQLQAEFRKYALNSGYAAQLEQIYNDRYNGTVLTKYTGPTWKHYPGATQDIVLRDHQKACVSRLLQNSTGLFHAVGTGKTFIMITGAMEMRRLGLARKPMIVVQNATLEQFAKDFKRLYPAARILCPNATQRNALNRNKTMARVATGDWDAVIVPQSFVNMLPDNPARQKAYIADRIAELKAAMIDARREQGERSPKAADIQKAITKLEESIEAIADRKTDNVLTFEELGVDALMVDEAHEYKKLEFSTKMDNVKGLDKGASQRGFSMMMKMRWVQEKNQGRNTVFATGTPVSNTIAEAWNMMRYLRPDILKHYGIEDFDSFASTFGTTISTSEMTPGGTWKQVTRFARYVNGPELLAAWRTVADVVSAEGVNLPGLPAVKNGKVTPVVVRQSPELTQYVSFLRSELERFAKMSGKEKRENTHIPIVVFGLARKASLDMRMIEPTLKDHPESKLNVAADRVAKIYHDTTPVKGTQMIFADQFQDNPESPKFNLYHEMRRKLVERGIPEDEILVVDNDIKEARRQVAFEKLKDGRYRVAIGGTQRMGTGINAQDHMVALHHLDAPPRPMDIEQRNGRILRQGNLNPEVEILNYGVENTLDAAMYQILAMKQKFINQLLRGELVGRDFEDAASEQSMSYEEQMAAFSGDPRAMEKVGLEFQVRTLQSLADSHASALIQSRKTLNDTVNNSIPNAKRKLAKSLEDSAAFQKAFSGGELTVKMGPNLEEVYHDTKQAVKALDTAFKKVISKAVSENKHEKLSIHVPVSDIEVNGERIHMKVSALSDINDVIKEEAAYIEWMFDRNNDGGNATTGAGFVHSLGAAVERSAKIPTGIQSGIERMDRDARELAGFVQQPFDRAEELANARARLSALTAQLVEEGQKSTEAQPEPSVPAPPAEPWMQPITRKPKEEGAQESAAAVQAEFYKRLGSGEWVPVPNAKRIILPDAEWADVFVYKDEKTKQWVVTESTTGMSLWRASTRNEAVNQSRAKLLDLGEENVRKLVSDVIAKQGGRPGTESHAMATGRGRTQRTATPTGTLSSVESGGEGRGEEANPPPSTTKPVPQDAPESALLKELDAFRAIAAPQTRSEPARFAANLLRELNAKQALEMARADHALAGYRKTFDRSPVPKDWEYDPSLPLPRNYAFIDAYEGGSVDMLGPKEASLVREFARQNAEWVDRIHALGTGALQHCIENYFPHLWDNPTRAKAVLSAILAKRPLEGPKSFLKQRTYELFREGLANGLKPVHDNPVDMWLLKKREVERYILARKFIKEMKAAGLMKFNYVFRRTPDGWSSPKDSAFDQWAPPSVTVREAFDAGIRAKTLEVMQKLGIPHERVTNLKNWGEARTSGPLVEGITTRFGGPDFVMFHEIGHALDAKYPDFKNTIQDFPMDSPLRVEIEKLAEERRREFGKFADQIPGKMYVQGWNERMAAIVQAYVHAPELMAQVAPTVKTAFEAFLKRHPELEILNEIKPSMVLAEAEAQLRLPGPVKLGQWILPNEATRVVDNYLSTGLNPRLWYRSLRGVSNLLNSVQLGLSAFHAGFTTLDIMATRLGAGIWDAAHGRPWDAAKTLASVPISPFTNLRLGSQIRSEALRPGSHGPEIAELVRQLEQAGGRVGQDAFYKTEFTRRMMRGFHEMTLSGAARGLASMPMAIIEQQARPIMEWLVPRQKLGAFAELARRSMSNLPDNAPPDMVREELRKAWDSVDNRMGQVVYDNLFYDRTLKDVALLSFRAYGWQLGKYREAYGAARDIIRGQFTHRTAYAMALPILVGVAGALTQYLMTGQGPQSWQDYFMPRTGEKDRNGNDVRLNFPSYVKDFVAYSKHPLTSLGHSLNPLISAMMDLFGNKDFYDVQIRNPDDPLFKQGSDVLKWAGGEVTPFAVSGRQKLAEDNAPAWKQIAPFFGITPAPQRMSLTPAQELMAEEMGRNFPSRPRTRESFDQSKLWAEAAQAWRTGDTARARELVQQAGREESVTQTASRMRTMVEKLKYTPMQFQAMHLPVDIVMRAWRLATSAERAQITPILRVRLGSQSIRPQDRAIWMREMQSAQQP